MFFVWGWLEFLIVNRIYNDWFKYKRDLLKVVRLFIELCGLGIGFEIMLLGLRFKLCSGIG